MLSEILQDDPKLFKAVLVYLDLKPLFYTGVFHKGKSKYSELSRFCGMSKRAFGYKIKLLEKKGFVSFNSDGDLILCSWSNFFELFGIKRKDPRHFRFYTCKNIYNLNLLSRQLIIQENFKKQEKAIEKKIYATEVLDNRVMNIVKQIHELNLSDIPTKDKERIREAKLFDIKSLELQKTHGTLRDFRKLKKNGLFQYHYIDALRGWYNNQRAFNHNHRVNFDISVSCKKVAELFGLSSGSSGYYWEKKLEEAGFCEKKPRSIYIPKVQSWAIQFSSKFDLEHHYFIGAKGDGVFKRLNNQLTFATLVKS